MINNSGEESRFPARIVLDPLNAIEGVYQRGYFTMIDEVASVFC